MLGEFPKLSERFIARELAWLARNGFDLRIFALRRGAAKLFNEDPFSGLRDSVTVLPHWISMRTMIAKLAQPLRALRAARLARYLPGSLAADPLGTLRVLPLLNRSYPLTAALLREEFSAIWAHWASTPGMTAMVSSWMTGLPMILSCHARDIFANRVLVAAQLASASAITVCSTAAREHLLASFSAPEERLHLIHHGVAAEEDLPPPSRMPSDRPLRLLGVGRLVAKKGFSHLVTAAHQGEFHLEIMGDGPLSSRLRAAAAAGPAAARIRFRPAGSAAELAQEFERSDVICAPSVKAADGDRDGVPNVLLEATLAGLPIISTDAGGLADLAQDGSTALVVQPKNPAAIVAAASRLQSEPQLAGALVRGARQLVAERFCLERNAGRLAELLKTVTV